MPIIKSAIKRVKQAAKRRDQNITTKKALKAAVKSFLASPSAEGLSKVQSTLDVAVKKNVLEKHTAARRKAQFARVAKEAGVKLNTGEKAAPKIAVVKPTEKSAAKPAAKTAAKSAVAPAEKKSAAKKAPVKKIVKKAE